MHDAFQKLMKVGFTEEQTAAFVSLVSETRGPKPAITANAAPRLTFKTFLPMAAIVIVVTIWSLWF